MSIGGFFKKAGSQLSKTSKDLQGGHVLDATKDAYQGSIGGQISSGIASNNDSIAGRLAKGDLQGAIAGTKSHKGDKADALAAQAAAQNDTQYAKNQGYSGQISANDASYLGSMNKNINRYQTDVDTLRGETEASQKDARNTYSNDIQPRMKDLMEKGQTNADQAMSLKDAMDPNNKVASGTRALYGAQGDKTRSDYNAEAANTRDEYNKQGAGIQKQYETQAQGEGKQGLADAGVLGALGMQNMAGQLGNVPMSGGQLQALMGANQAQTGAAYSKNLQRQQSLRDQGLSGNISEQNLGLNNATQQRDTGLGRSSDLQAQGLAQGFARSDVAYNQGQNAVKDYGQSVQNYEGASDRQLARDTDFRNQRNGYSGQTYGLAQQMNDANRGVANGGVMRDMAIDNTHAGGQMANIASQIQGINGQQASDAAMKTGALQAGGTVAGAYFGGPAGAAAGNQAGQQIGNANAPTPTAVPHAGNYNSAYQYGDQGPQGGGLAGPDAGGGAANGLSLTGGTRGMPVQGGQPQFRNPYQAQNPAMQQRPDAGPAGGRFMTGQAGGYGVNGAQDPRTAANRQALANFQRRQGR